MSNNKKEVKIYNINELEQREREILEIAEAVSGEKDAFEVKLTETSLTTTEKSTGKTMRISILE